MSVVLRYEMKFDAATKSMDAAFPALVYHLNKGPRSCSDDSAPM